MKSVGDILKTERLKQGRTTLEIANAIRTKEKNVIAIENNDFSVFPAEIYALSFVRDYAEYLRLNPEEVTPFFRRTVEIKRSKNKQSENENLNGQSIISHTDELGKNLSKKILSLGTILILTIFVGFLIYEYQRNILHPSLEIYAPIADSKTSRKDISVSGKTDLENKVFVNGEEVELDSKGKFKVVIDLKKGLNKITFKAVNNYQKLTEVEKNVFRK